jgi:hypothetical protein
MRNRSFSFALAVACLLVATACSYTPPKPGSQQAERYPFRDTKGAITVGVNPFLSEERLHEVLSSAGSYLDNNVLPIQLLIRNDGQDELLFRTANVRLVWPDATPRNPLSVPDTFEAVKSSVAAGAIMGGVIGASAVSTQNEHKMKDLMAVSLKDTNLSPRSALTGFLFFPLQKSDASLKGTRLQLILQNPTSLTETTCEIGLGGDLPKGRGTMPAKP